MCLRLLAPGIFRVDHAHRQHDETHMTETPARYGLPTECPSDHACPGCPHNVARGHCHPPTFYGSGTVHEVLTGSLDVIHFLAQALDALESNHKHCLDAQAVRGVGLIMTDLTRGIHSCCDRHALPLAVPAHPNRP